MAYLYPTVSAPGQGQIVASGLGTPVAYGTPTTSNAVLENGELTLAVQASGAAWGWSTIPVIGAEVTGLQCRIRRMDWGNTGGVYPGIYLKSSTGQVVYLTSSGSGRYCFSYSATTFPTGITDEYNQNSAFFGEPALKFTWNATDVFPWASTGGDVWKIFRGGGFGRAGRLLDVVEAGACALATTGYWGSATFDIAEAL